MKTLLLRTAALAVFAAANSGCSPSASERREISGTVTYNGEPVPNGTIYFETDVSTGNNGPQAVADIKNGRYKTRPEFGAVAGPHDVRVTILPGAGDDPGESRPKRTGVRPGEYTTTVDIQPGGTEINFTLPFPKK